MFLLAFALLISPLAAYAEEGLRRTVEALSATESRMTGYPGTEAARDCGCVMTAEEHQIRGGLGSAVAEVLVTGAPVPMAFCGMDDEFGQSGDAWDLVSHYGLDGPGLAASARALVESKNA